MSLIGWIPDATAQDTGPVQLGSPVQPIKLVDDGKDTIAFSMNKTDGMELLDFIKWAQQITNKRFTFNAVELASGSPGGSKVHFLGTFRFPREQFQRDFYSFFLTMLYIKGFAVVPRGEGKMELLEIVLMHGARGREISNSARYVAPDELDEYRHQAGVPILTTVPLHHIDAPRANNALRPFFASTGAAGPGSSVTLGNVGNKSALLLQGFGPQVYAAVQLLKLADTPDQEHESAQPDGAPATVGAASKTEPSQLIMKVVVLEHLDPETLQSILTESLGAEPQPAPEQRPGEPTGNSDEGGETVSFSMRKPEGMELTEFIQWAQEVTGKRFTYNAQELASGSAGGRTVNFLGQLRVRKDRFQEDFFSFFQTMLYIKGFAIVPRGEGDLELLEIVMMTGARGREVTNGARYVAPDELDDYRHQTGVPILTTVTLRHTNALLAHNALRPFFASTGGQHAGGSVQVGNVGNKSGLLLQGFGPQVYAAVQLLKIVDTPANKPGLGLRVVAHKATRSLLVSGTEEQVQKALRLIARLDVPRDAPAPDARTEEPPEIIRMVHRLPDDLRKKLQLITGKQKHPGSTTARQSYQAAAAWRPPASASWRSSVCRSWLAP